MLAYDQLLIVGRFTTLNGAIRNGIAFVSPTGILYTNYNPNINGWVDDLAVQSDGKVLIGGAFTTVDGVSRVGVARLNADGTLDTAFNPDLNYFVYSLLVQADGRVLIGGAFTRVNGEDRNYVARLNTDGTLDSRFLNANIGSIPNGDVRSLVVQSDGKVLIGGAFTTVGGGARNYAARLNADGTLDSGFFPNANDVIESLALLADGKVLIGGAFTTVGGVAHSSLARLNSAPTVTSPTKAGISATGVTLGGNVIADGGVPIVEQGVVYAPLATNSNPLIGGIGVTKVTAPGIASLFNMEVLGLIEGTVYGYKAYATNSLGASYSFLDTFTAGASGSLDSIFNPNPNSIVTSLAVQADGKVLIGGFFTTVGGVVRNNLARLNADGTLDTTFNPNANDGISSLVIRSDGKILIGGYFTTVGGVARNYLARLNTDGTLDNSFNANVNDWVYDVVLEKNGSVLIAGNFTSVGGVARNYLARLNYDGILNTRFAPTPNKAVFRVAVQADDRVLIGGAFTIVNGNERNYVARLWGDGYGTLDPYFSANVDQMPNGEVGNIAVQADKKILIAGEFATLDGVAHNGVARLNADGTQDISFNINVNDVVNDIAVKPNGKILLGGFFTTVGGIARNYLAQLNADGTLDTSFNHTPNDAVLSLALQANGNVLIGGYFSKVSGVARNYLARLTASRPTVTTPTAADISGTGATLGGNVTADGDAAIIERGVVYALTANNPDPFIGSPTATRVTAVGTTGVFTVATSDLVTGTAYSYKAYSTNAQGTSYTVVGTFTTPGTRPGVDTNFDPKLNDGALVRSLVVQADGRVLIGGLFNNVGGVPRRNLARLNVDGTLDTGFIDPDLSGSVHSILVQADGKVLIAGEFTAVRGERRDFVARLNGDGTLDSSFNPNGNRISGFISYNYHLRLAAQADGKILIAGSFTTGGGVAANLARLNTDGSLDTTFKAKPDSYVADVVVQAGGSVLIGGKFKTINGDFRSYIARLNANGTLDTSFVDPKLGGGGVNNITLKNDGKILISGTFTSFFNSISVPGGIKLNTDGTWDGKFNADGTLDRESTFGGYESLRTVMQPDGKVLIGGPLDVFRLNADLTDDSSFDPQPKGGNVDVHDIGVQADGRVLIAGQFTSVGGLPRRGIARINSVPMLIDPSVESISPRSAILGGNVMADGGETITERGVVYAATAVNSSPAIDGLGVTKATVPGTSGVFTLPVDLLNPVTDYSFRVFATNTLGTSYSGVISFRTLPVADLSALTLSSGTLSPGFNSGTLNYTSSVRAAQTSFALSADLAQAGATIQVRVNGGAYSNLASGASSQALPLSLGNNTVEIKVISQDGFTTKIYTVTINRSSVIFALGDSLSSVDGGFTGTAPDYYNGRWSNGPVWTEQFASSYGRSLSFGQTVFASGGAVTGDLDGQVSGLLSSTSWLGLSSTAKNESIVTLWCGGNDLLNKAGEDVFDLSVANWTTIINQSVNDIRAAIVRLNGAGARIVVVPNLPDLSRLPAATAYGLTTAEKTFAKARVVDFNNALKAAIVSLRSTLPSMRMVEVDIFAKFNAMLAAPASYGLTKTSIGALQDASLASKSFSGAGASYMFWDFIHPTTKVHGLIAQWAKEALGGAGLTPPVIKTQPVGQQIVKGAPFTLSVVAEGTGCSYQWQHEGVDIPGATGASYKDLSASETDAGSYSVSVSNAGGEVISADAVIVVQLPPVLITLPSSQLAAVGDPISFEAGAEGEGLTYVWKRSGAVIAGASGSLFNLASATLSNAGSYVVEVSNKAGKATSSANAAQLGVVDTTAKTSILGTAATASFTITTAGNGLTYAWKKDGSDLPVDARITGATAKALTIKNLSADDAGIYTCEVTGPGGTLSGGANTLVVFSQKPEILTPVVMPDAIVSGNYSFLIPVNESGNLTPTSYTATGLPTGLTCNATTGVISGKPSVSKATPYAVTLKASNAKGSTTATSTLLVQALPATLTGTFSGLVDRNTELSGPAVGSTLQGHGGTLSNLVITSTGNFTGTLLLEEKSYAIPGGSRLDAELDADATATVKLLRGTAADSIPDLTLQFTINKDTGELTGTLSDGGAGLPIDLHGWRQAAPTSGRAGAYTAALDIQDQVLVGDIAYQQGNGYLAMSVSATGVVTWGGKLADGTAITGSSTVAAGGEIPFHQLLYSTTSAATAGSAHGWVKISDDAAPTVNGGKALLDGAIDWLKKPQASSSTTRSYKQGFPLHNLVVAGGRYGAPAAGQVLLGLVDGGVGTTNASLKFTEGGLTGPAPIVGAVMASNVGSVPVRITSTNAMVMLTGSDNPAGVSLKITASSGLMSGSFVLKNDPDPTDTTAPIALLSRTANYAGVLVPRLGMGVGQFQLAELPSQQGSVKTTLSTSPIWSGQVTFGSP